MARKTKRPFGSAHGKQALGAPVTKSNQTPYPTGVHRQKTVKAVPTSTFGTRPKRRMPNIKAPTTSYGKGV
jgi:hypothetical protein